jgi:hypothetical protein
VESKPCPCAAEPGIPATLDFNEASLRCESELVISGMRKLEFAEGQSWFRRDRRIEGNEQGLAFVDVL